VRLGASHGGHVVHQLAHALDQDLALCLSPGGVGGPGHEGVENVLDRGGAQIRLRPHGNELQLPALDELAVDLGDVLLGRGVVGEVDASGGLRAAALRRLGRKLLALVLHLLPAPSDWMIQALAVRAGITTIAARVEGGCRRRRLVHVLGDRRPLAQRVKVGGRRSGAGDDVLHVVVDGADGDEPARDDRVLGFGGEVGQIDDRERLRPPVGFVNSLAHGAEELIRGVDVARREVLEGRRCPGLGEPSLHTRVHPGRGDEEERGDFAYLAPGALKLRPARQEDLVEFFVAILVLVGRNERGQLRRDCRDRGVDWSAILEG